MTGDDTVLLRRRVPGDDEALAELDRQSPDGGLIAFSSHAHVSPEDAVVGTYDEVVDVVAQDRVTGRLVGTARVSLDRCRVHGRVRPAALLGALSVHPDHRRRGIGRQLAAWRLDHAERRCGPDLVVIAEIQAGNVASVANARTWADQLVGHLVVAPVPMRSRQPRARSGVLVRGWRPDDLPEVADRLAAFAADHELSSPQDAAGLHRWLTTSPFRDPVNHYLVALDPAGRMLAGIGLREEGRLRSLDVQRMPAAVRVANLALRVVPRDGRMRNLQVSRTWCLPGRADAARQLWDTARWVLRERSTSLVTTYDPRSPLAAAFRTPPWMPTTSITLAVRGPDPLRDTDILSPFA